MFKRKPFRYELESMAEDKKINTRYYLIIGALFCCIPLFMLIITYFE